MNNFYCQMEFHPIGQGLFSTGVIEGRDSRQVHWVYDCGTVSSQDLVRSEIDRYIDTFKPAPPRIHLVVISHFDYDHISGIVQLLRSAEVDVLLLPYMPLSRRIALAFERKFRVNSRPFRFLLDPVGFIRRDSAFKVKKIVLVPGGDGEAWRSPDSDSVDPLDLNEEVNIRYQIVDQQEMDDEQRKEISDHKDVEILVPNSCLLVGKYWEFVPYNDIYERRPPPRVFCDAVAKQRGDLLKSPTKSNLEKLKKIYDDRFKKGSINRNIISLFLYAGFTQKNVLIAHRVCTDVLGISSNLERRFYMTNSKVDCCGILYTGDGFLSTLASVKRLQNYFGPIRMNQNFALQVMHHGSKKNWYQGVAKTFSPICSIFSSDPDTRNKHPDAEVVRDFLPFVPIQVNKSNRFVIHFTAYYH